MFTAYSHINFLHFTMDTSFQPPHGGYKFQSPVRLGFLTAKMMETKFKWKTTTKYHFFAFATELLVFFFHMPQITML